MSNLENIFTKDVISHYKRNKSEITPDLLMSLRSVGNSGKNIALEILDMEKAREGHYVDAFGSKISYNGIITIKGAYTKLELEEIHKEEILKCSQDVYYFMDNYCKIVTKSGTNFPELRPYQKTYLNDMVNEEAVVSLQSRQCCASDTSVDIVDESGTKNTTIEELFNDCKGDFCEII